MGILVFDWAASVAASWLWEIYSSCRLWHLPKLVFLLIRELWEGLSTPLGGVHNRDELGSWLRILENIDWDNPRDVKRHWHCRTNPHTGHHPCIDPIFLGRWHPQCGDFVYVHPWKNVLISEEEKRDYCRFGRPYTPHGHPRGYIELKIPVQFRERDTPISPPRGQRFGSQSSFVVPRSSDLDVITIRFRRDKVGTINMDPIPKDVRELIIQEFAQDLGLFRRNEIPCQEEVCDRLVLIVNAKQEGMKSPLYRACICRFLRDAGVSHPPRNERTDTLSFFCDLIASRIRRAQSKEPRLDVEMTDAPTSDQPNNVTNEVSDKGRIASSVEGGRSSRARTSSGAHQVVVRTPTVAGEKRKTTGDKEPILPPAKRVGADKDGSYESPVTRAAVDSEHIDQSAANTCTSDQVADGANVDVTTTPTTN